MSNENNTLNRGKHNNYNNQQTFEEMLLQGGYPQTNIMRDGKIHRFGKDDKLWYVYCDTHAVAEDWSGELPKVYWSDKQKWNALSKEERENLQRGASSI